MGVRVKQHQEAVASGVVADIPAEYNIRFPFRDIQQAHDFAKNLNNKTLVAPDGRKRDRRLELVSYYCSTFLLHTKNVCPKPSAKLFVLDTALFSYLTVDMQYSVLMCFLIHETICSWNGSDTYCSQGSLRAQMTWFVELGSSCSVQSCNQCTILIR
jgi:hypothetical protein